MDLVSGRYVVDAKSIMGIFSLDLERPLTVKVIAGDEKAVYDVVKEFANDTVNAA